MSLTATEQKQLLQQEIAALRGAISRHDKPSAPSHTGYHPYARGRPARGPSTYRGAPRGRGRGGGGRGGSYSLDLRNVKQPIASSSTTPSSTLPATKPSSSVVEREAGELSPPHQATKPAEEKEDNSWVKKTSKRRNMSLMTVEKSNHLQALGPRPLRQKPARVPAQIQILNSTTSSAGDQKVVIDGVIFQFEEGGQKLTRIGEVAPEVGTSSIKASPRTRKSVAFGGQRFKRNNTGDLVSSSSRWVGLRGVAELFSPGSVNKPCRFYTKTGRCNRALTCPFTHDPSRLSICPKYLRSTCPHSSSSCPLSHSPKPHNTPSCVHFQATSTCRNPQPCLYPHVRVSDSAPVCEAFAREGWCDVEAGECGELHVWECGEWRARGVCSRGGRCGLRHVIRAEKGKGSVEEAEKEGMARSQEVQVEAAGKGGGGDGDLPVEGGFEGQDEFITFDQGSPQEISSEDEDSESEEDEGEKGKLSKRSVSPTDKVIEEDTAMDSDDASDDGALDVVF